MDKKRKNTLTTIVIIIILIVIYLASHSSGSEESTQVASSVVSTESVQEESTTAEEETSAVSVSTESDTSVSTESAAATDTETSEVIADPSADPLVPNADEDMEIVDIGDCSVTLTLVPDPEGYALTAEVEDGDLDALSYGGEDTEIWEGESERYTEDNVPMTATSQQYLVDVTVSDEGEEEEVRLDATLYYTDEQLEDLYWNQGTFDAVTDSVDYHFNKHHEEVDASNMQEYLTAALDCRDDALENPDDFRITESQGETAAHKYKNYDDDRFIILTDEGDEILSFGR